MHEARFVVRVTDGAIINERPEGTIERVALDALAAVLIETTNTGPWGADVWWLLIGADLQSGCVFPMGATGEHEVLKALQQLPGFDNEAFIEAMACTEDGRFLCWQATS